MLADGYNLDNDCKRTLEFLNQHGPYRSLRVSVEEPNLQTGAVEARHEQLTALSAAIYSKEYQAAYVIAQKFPALIGMRDSRGNTPLHYLCAQLQNTTIRNEVPYKLLGLLSHQINLSNNDSVTPIFKTQDPEAILCLHAMGAELNVTNISAIRPQIWRRKTILAVVHALGIDARFLARTFDYRKNKIIEQYKYIEPELPLILPLVAFDVAEYTLGAHPIIATLQARELHGRQTRNVLDNRQRMIAAHSTTAAKRSQHPDEILDDAKHQRTE
jgi:hypothetical protein